MPIKRIMTAVVVAFIATGCAYTPQTVTIAPTIEVAESDAGASKPVNVYVVDERTSTQLGRRGTGMMQGAAITTEQDIASVYATTIVDGLNKKGYAAQAVSGMNKPDNGVLLRIDIRSIEYETSTGFWTGGVHVKGSMKSTATQGDRAYDNLYRVDDEKRVVVVPGANQNEEMINTAVSSVIQEMFNDTALFEFLNN